jgi:uncharacterized protein YceH (UPF0502 family)
MGDLLRRHWIWAQSSSNPQVVSGLKKSANQWTIKHLEIFFRNEGGGMIAPSVVKSAKANPIMATDFSKSSNSSQSEPSSNPSTSAAGAERLWKPLTKIQRRVLGVLIEKSKTTPDVYPMTVNGIRTGSNQKSNRSPLMDLNEDQIDKTLEELRQLGCVMEVHSGGRVPKYRHLAYEWLGVEKGELSVLTELLLRGEQTLGELRSRTARMEQRLQGLDDLSPILQELKRKGLLLELTPKGRGQVVTHNLYPDTERERLQTEFKLQQHSDHSADFEQPPQTLPTTQPPWNPESRQSNPVLSPALSPYDPVESGEGRQPLDDRVAQLEHQVAELQEMLQQLKNLIES